MIFPLRLQTAPAYIVLVMLVSMTACSDPAEWAGTIEEIGSVVYVSNPADPLWETGDEPRVSLELEQVFGADRVPEAAILGEPYELYAAVDGNGNVYVLDGQANRLISFAPDGIVRWRAGQVGGGPGEFNDPAEIAVDANGGIVVMNLGRTRLDTWDSDGNFLSSRTLSEPPLSVPSLAFPFIAGFSSRVLKNSVFPSKI